MGDLFARDGNNFFCKCSDPPRLMYWRERKIEEWRTIDIYVCPLCWHEVHKSTLIESVEGLREEFGMNLNQLPLPLGGVKCNCKFCYRGQYFSWHCPTHGNMTGRDYLALCITLFEADLISIDSLIGYVIPNP